MFAWMAMAILVFAAPVFAQGEAIIQGQLRARADESALSNARLLLKSRSGQPFGETTTDAGGHFVFTGVAPGEYVLSASAEGFAPRELRLTIAPREVRALDIALDLSGVSVRVAVTGEPQPSTHSPGSTLLTRERLEQMPLAERTNLPDAIVTAAPGMIRGHDDFVHIRGHEVALNPTINGVQFWENAHAVFSPGLGVDYVEAINVMTGGFPAEYGNRFGGILDVVTKSGFTLSDRGSVSLGVGAARRNNAAVEFGGRRSRRAYYLNVGGFMSDRFLSPPSPRAIHDSGHGIRSFGRVDFRQSENDVFNVIATGDGVDFDLPMEERDALLRPGFQNRQRTRSQDVVASWNHVRSSNLVIQSSFYQRWSTVHQFPETTDRYGAQTDAERSLRTVGLKSDVTKLSGRHAFKAGVDAVVLQPREDFFYLSQPWIDFTHLPDVNEAHVHFRGPNLGAGVPRPVIFSGRETGGQLSVYAQDKLQLTPALSLDLGARVDRYGLEISETHVSPRINAAYRLPSGTVLFASYNHFFVPPPIENILAGSAGLTGLLSEIGRALPPVQAIKEHQFETGVTHPVHQAGTVSLTGYYRVSDDPPHTSLLPDSRFYTYATFDKGKAYGMEVKAEARKASLGLSGYVNYALGRVWFYNPIVAGFTTEADHLTETGRLLAPMDQTHTLTSGLTYNHERTRVWSSIDVEYGSGTPGEHGQGEHDDAEGEAHEHASGPGLCGARCPSRVIPSVSIGWNAPSRGAAPRLSVQVNVENVTNKVYLLSKESSMVQGQYSIPRLITASVRLRF